MIYASCCAPDAGNIEADTLVVTQGRIEILEGGDNTLVIMETRLDIPTAEGGTTQVTRRATYVFRQEGERWLCTVDNSYGTDLLDAPVS